MSLSLMRQYLTSLPNPDVNPRLQIVAALLTNPALLTIYQTRSQQWRLIRITGGDVTLPASFEELVQFASKMVISLSVLARTAEETRLYAEMEFLLRIIANMDEEHHGLLPTASAADLRAFSDRFKRQADIQAAEQAAKQNKEALSLQEWISH